MAKKSAALPMSSTRAEPLLRDGGLHRPAVVRAHLVQPLGRDVAGHDRVDGDARGGELDRGGAQEAELGGLAGAVVRPARVAGDRAGDRGGQDHAPAPARREGGQARLHREHRALEVAGEDARRRPPRSSRRASCRGRRRRWRRGRRSRRSARPPPRPSARSPRRGDVGQHVATSPPPPPSSSAAASPRSSSRAATAPWRPRRRTRRRCPCRCPCCRR